MTRKHAGDCYCDACHERDYWRRHPPGTHCACVDCVGRWGIDVPHPDGDGPYTVMYFPDPRQPIAVEVTDTKGEMGRRLFDAAGAVLAHYQRGQDR